MTRGWFGTGELGRAGSGVKPDPGTEYLHTLRYLLAAKSCLAGPVQFPFGVLAVLFV